MVRKKNFGQSGNFLESQVYFQTIFLQFDLIGFNQNNFQFIAMKRMFQGPTISSVLPWTAGFAAETGGILSMVQTGVTTLRWWIE